jgi:hypothetical protein
MFCHGYGDGWLLDSGLTSYKGWRLTIGIYDTMLFRPYTALSCCAARVCEHWASKTEFPLRSNDHEASCLGMPFVPGIALCREGAIVIGRSLSGRFAEDDSEDFSLLKEFPVSNIESYEKISK